MSISRKANRSQQFLLPPSLDELIPADDPVRFIADLVASLDLETLGFVDPPREARGQPPFSCELLLSVWLYCYFRRVRSLRQMEAACAELPEPLPTLPPSGRTLQLAPAGTGAGGHAAPPDHRRLAEDLQALRRAVERVETVLRQGIVVDIQCAQRPVKEVHHPHFGR